MTGSTPSTTSGPALHLCLGLSAAPRTIRTGMPLLQSAGSANRIYALIVIASLPAMAAGCWNLGAQLLAQLTLDPAAWSATLGWRGAIVSPGAGDAGMGSALLLGLSYVVPLLVAALATAAFWQIVFVRGRQQFPDAGWIMHAWLFVCLLPPSATPIMAVIALSFGVLVGSHIFGGSGRYLASPALLGALFLHLGYGDFSAYTLPITGLEGAPSWQGLLTQPPVDGWWPLLLGAELGRLATGSALACMAGALLLIWTGVASWRVLAGGMAGVLAMGLLTAWLTPTAQLAGMPWYGHVAVGNLAFLLAFVVVDPSCQALTRTGRWLHGALFGLLTVLIRSYDGRHPEAALFAALLAALAVPLIDYLVLSPWRRAWERAS